MDLDNTATAITRAYSWEVEQRLPQDSVAHDLGTLISQRHAVDPTVRWRTLFEEWNAGDNAPIVVALQKEAKQLKTYFNEFQVGLPKEDRVNFDHSHPSIEDLVDMVERMSQAWQKKREKGAKGKFMSYFRKFCGTLDAHKSLINILPQGNEYVSLFTGSLTAIIQASANHEGVAKTLADSLSLISEHIAACSGELELYKTEKMQHAVADLYAHIFVLLQDIMKWYLKRSYKHLLGSFNEKLEELFLEEIENIRVKSEVIRREAGRGTAGEVRVTRLLAEQVHDDLRLGLEGVARMHLEQRLENQRIQKVWDRKFEIFERQEQNVRKLTSKLDQLLEQQATAYLSDRQPMLLANSPFSSHHPSQVSLLLGGGSGRTSAAGFRGWSKDEVVESSKSLEAYFHRDRIRLRCDPLSPVLVDPQALKRLSLWTSQVNSSILYIAGHSSVSSGVENPVTWLAAKFVDFADKSGTFVLSYFSSTRRDEGVRTGITVEMQSLIAIVYALIRQTIELLPLVIDSDADLSAHSFAELNGTAESWDEALSMLRCLLPLLPEGAGFCVIDGFQSVDDESTEGAVKELLQILRGSRMKILFTTTGRSRSLLRELDRTELVLVDQVGSKSKMTRGFM